MISLNYIQIRQRLEHCDSVQLNIRCKEIITCDISNRITSEIVAAGFNSA